MEEEPKFEICRSFGGDLCTTVDSLDYILTKTMYGDILNLKAEDQALIKWVLGKIRHQLYSCVREYREDEFRGEENGRKTEV